MMNPQSKVREFLVDYNPKHVRYNCTQHEEIVYKYEKVKVIEKSAYDKAVEALKVISKDTYEANPWTVVDTMSARKARETLRELGEL